MSFSFYILALLPILLAPIATGRMALAALSWQRRQIVLDNAAVIVGKSQRAWAHALIDHNEKLRFLEIAHHTAHACARAAVIALPCVAADASLEADIVLQHEIVLAHATALWQRALWDARFYLTEHGLQARVSGREAAPVHSQLCPICGLEVYWERDTGKLETHFVERGEPDLGVVTELEGRTLVLPSAWNYVLNTVKGR